jgi:thiamine biosynthesis lipoprotein
MIHHTFTSMGTTIECFLDAEPDADAWASIWAVEAEFHRLDGLLSRFRPDSELSQLNERGSLVVGPDLLRVTELALEARTRTSGRVDPTVHDAVIAAGYDRTFAEIPLDRQGRPVQTAVACRGRVVVDRRLSIVELDPGVHLDLGGIAKGDAADRACEILGEAGPCFVSAGGDLAIRGVPRAGYWPVDVETADDTVHLRLTTGAVATSGRDRGRWRVGGEERHHLIDPATGSPAETGLLRVTVVAATAVEGEIMAKALFLAGEDAAVREADELRLPAILVTQDGRTRWAGGLEAP